MIGTCTVNSVSDPVQDAKKNTVCFAGETMGYERYSILSVMGPLLSLGLIVS